MRVEHQAEDHLIVVFSVAPFLLDFPKKSAGEELRSESPCIVERFDNKNEFVGIPFGPEKKKLLPRSLT